MQLSTKKIVVVAYLQLSHVGIFVNCSQSSQSSHIFESQARVRIYIMSFPKKSRQVNTIFPKKVDGFLKTLTLS